MSVFDEKFIGEVRADLKPIVLIAATTHWFPTARLAMALADAGFVVDGVCPLRHPLCKTRAVRKVHAYHGLAPLRSLGLAIAASNPALIIPGDDLATRHLHHLYERECSRGNHGSDTCALIERSFGAPESFTVVYKRAEFIQLARQEGVRAPETAAIANFEDLREWMGRGGFPFVLKADGTSGGDGVRVVQTLEEAERAYRILNAPPLLARAAKRALIDKDRTLVWPSLLRQRPVVNAQAFVDGSEVTSTVACWQGEVLADLHFEVVHKKYSAGPATVMRLIKNADMSNAVKKMVRRLNLSGMHGFDFMLESKSSHANLIEINPRATQVGHLTLGSGHDLPAALYAAVTGTEIRPRKAMTQGDTIALFPQEWMRDPSSPWLQSVYHDVPWQEPRLLNACLQRGLNEISARRRQESSSLQVMENQELKRRQPRSPATQWQPNSPLNEGKAEYLHSNE